MSRSQARRALSGAWRGCGVLLLLPPAALAVHQLRYLMAYGSGAGAELQETGHSYLHSVVPWIVLLLALSAGVLLRSLGRALAGTVTRTPRSFSFVGLWLACAGALVAIFVCQEFLEGLFATGHPAGLAGIFGYGGWWAIPAALGVGLALAACLYGTRWMLSVVAQRCGKGPRACRAKPARVRLARFDSVPTLAPMVAGWSDRGPPG
jgi:hypothetical protein